MARGDFESLRVWQNARDFVNSIYDLMDIIRIMGFGIRFKEPL